MSQQQAPQHPNNGDGEALFVMGYDEHAAYQSVAQQLTRQVEPTPEASPDATREDEDGGIIRRTNEFRSQLGPVMLESVGLAGMEIAKSNERRARDLYRNKFPLLVPAFERVCRDCNLTFDDEDVTECPECGEDTEPPDDEQRAEARAFFEAVNKEGQSLAELYQSLAKDAGRLGGWTHVVRYNYGVINGAVMQEPVELVRADPKRLKPVVDENLRIGGYYWACPIHRVPYLEDETADRNGRCPEVSVITKDDGTQVEVPCNAELREVFFAEVDTINYRGRSADRKPEKVYFEDEVIDFAAFNERLSGHDWLSPVEHLWKRQAILEWMNTYAGAFFDDQNTERYPGRILMLHTSNRDLVEKQLKEAADERSADVYKNGVLYNPVPREGGSGRDQAQVLDMASDEIIGQSPDLKKDFKSDIRNVYGQTDVQDSELEDASGLNNEGLELTVRNDAIVSWHSELKDGPLAKLTRVLGLTDWDISFVPPEEPREETRPEDIVQAAATAEQAGIPYEIADGQFMLADTDGVVEPEGETPEPEAGGFQGRGTGNGRPTPKRGTTEVDVGLAEEAVRRAVRELDSDGAREATRFLEAAYDHAFAVETEADVEQQAQITIDDDGDVPQFAQELLGDAVDGGAIHQPDALTDRQFRIMETVVKDSLTQAAGWSVDSIDRRFAPTVPDIPADERRRYTQNAVQNVVQAALQLGYMIEGDLDDRRFYLGGPERANTCEACEALLERTNPSHGGEPVPLDEFRDLAVNTAEQHGIGAEYVSGGQIHPACIHRLVEHREARE